MTSSQSTTQTPGAKMMYLIRRRQGVSREELIAHWFANHMPGVIRFQEMQASAGKTAARRYIATLFDADQQGGWDGVAQLWFDQALPAPKEPHGKTPTDSFQERAEPYSPWATSEYVVIDGDLPVRPLILNPPFPTTRSGFYKVTSLVTAKPGADHQALCALWLEHHAPIAARTIEKHGGFRYVLSLSQSPTAAPYAGMAEIYFQEEASWRACAAELTPDGMEDFIEGATIVSAGTEMVGIP
ncbi:MAG TPA: EthD domain-containing protein [Pseudomonadales bacterium]